MFKGLKRILIVLFWASIVFIALEGPTAAIMIHNMMFNFFHLVTVIFFGSGTAPKISVH